MSEMSEHRLTITTPSDTELVMTRTFDAPRTLVWDALTKPELIRRWSFGPDGWEFEVCEVDLRVGGRYRFVTRKGDERVEWGGEYREIAAPERLVHTEAFVEPWYAGEALDTSVLTEVDGRTTLEVTVLVDSKEGRDAMLASGMESGVVASYDRLEAILATLA